MSSESSPITGATFSDISALSYEPPEHRLEYGTGALQFAEGWTSASSNRTLLMIHGGCWQSAYDLKHVRPLCAAVRSLGWNIWSLEYRRIGDEGGGWPGTFEDILAGVSEVRRSLDHDEKFVIAGHSAGGHLALWVSTRLGGNHPGQPSPAIDLTIGLAAISDLDSYSRGDSPCELSTISLLGGTPEEHPKRYAEASPLQLRSLEKNQRIALLHGTNDAIVPVSQSRRFATETTSAMLEIESAGHFDLVHPGSVAFPILKQTLASA